MIRILIVDDQNLVREGIKILLEKATDIKIVGDAKDGNSALEKISILQPDVLLLDIDMPGIDGLTVADKIRQKYPQIKIIMLSSHEDESYVRKATALGARGYLLKSASSQQLEWSIKLVNQGYSTIKSELLEEQLGPNSSSIPPKPSIELKSTSSFSGEKIDFPPIAHKSETASMSEQDQANLNKLELLLAKNQLQQKYTSSSAQEKKRGGSNNLFSRTQSSRVRKTMMSFEFKLLVFVILFSLGFLIFIALS